jgi:hypothetical protein
MLQQCGVQVASMEAGRMVMRVRDVAMGVH